MFYPVVHADMFILDLLTIICSLQPHIQMQMLDMSVECFANGVTVNYKHVSHKAESRAVSWMSNAARSPH